MTGPLYSIFASKCPKCNLGDLYLDQNAYHIRSLSKMHRRCSFCEQVYERETGFFYGAMYVSYGVSIIVMFIPAAILYFGFDAGFKVLLATIFGIYLFMYPLLFRWSRNIWLNIFVHYDEEVREKVLSERQVTG